MSRLRPQRSRPCVRLLWLCLLALKGCSPEAVPVEQAPQQAAPAVELTEIRLSAESLQTGEISSQPIVRRSLVESMTATGRVQINQDTSARVGALAEGRVRRVDVTVGDRVEKGQPLVWIHSHELIDARAAFTRAQTELTLAEQTLRYSQAELERAVRLLDAKAISARQQLRAEADVVTAEAGLRHANAELQRADEFVRHLGSDPEAPSEEEDVVIRSPISGIVMKRNVTVGSVVNPTDDLLIVSDLSSLWVVAEVPSRRSSLVRMGQPVRIRVPAFPKADFQAHVVYLAESLDPGTRTVRVRCLIRDRSRRLRPEMYATIHIDIGSTEPLIVVPSAAVQDVEGDSVVFVDHGGGRFEKRIVTTGREQVGLYEITAGLQEGERIVTEGAFLIKTEFLKGTIEE